MAEAGGAEPGKPPPVASLERALDQVCEFLGRSEQSARVRALVIEARRLRNAVGNWRSITPDPDVREEMIARVLRLANDAEDVVAAERPPTEIQDDSGAHSSGAASARRDTPTAVNSKRSLAIGLRLGPGPTPGSPPGTPVSSKKTPTPPGTATLQGGLVGAQDGQAASAKPQEGNGRRSSPEGRWSQESAQTTTSSSPAREQTGSVPVPTLDFGATLSSPSLSGANVAAEISKAGAGPQQRGSSLTREQALQLDRVIAPPARDVGVYGVHMPPPAAPLLERSLTSTFVSPPSLIPPDRGAQPPAPANANPPPQPAAPPLERSPTNSFVPPPSLVFDRSQLPLGNNYQPPPPPAAKPLERSLTNTFASPPSLVFDRVIPPAGQNRVADAKPPLRAPEEMFEGPPSLQPPSMHVGQMNLAPGPDSMALAAEFGPTIHSDSISVRSLPLPEALDPRFVMIRDPYSPQADAYRTLRRKLSTITATTIAVTSALPGEGKTTCALNLAFALRETIRGRILVVEANIRAPGIAAALQFDPPLCFTEQLQRHRDNRLTPWIVVEQAAPLHPSQPGEERSESSPDHRGSSPSGLKLPEPRASMLAPIHILAVNPRSEQPPMIDAVAFSMGIESLKSAGYTYIIIDTPPVLGSMDMHVIGDSVNGVLLTSLVKKSTRRSLRQAIERLRPAPVLGVVLLDY